MVDLNVRLEDGGEAPFAELLSEALQPFVPGQAPGTPAYNPAWYALTDIYLDPVSGSDANSGQVGDPVKTMAEVNRRYGSSSPQLVYGQSLTVHQLSAQTPGVDAFFFDPRLSGASKFVWDALTSAPPVGIAFSPTTVTAKVQTAAGNDLKITGALPGAMASNQLIHNITRDSWAVVEKVAAGTATICQPLTAASLLTPAQIPTFVEDNGWVHTNSFQLYTPQALNWRNPRPSGGDTDATYTDGTAWIKGVHITDAFGPGGSDWAVSSTGLTLVFALSLIEPFLLTDGNATIALGFASCAILGGGYLFNNCTMAGGYCPSTIETSQSFIVNDAIVDTIIAQAFGLTLFAAAHVVTSMTCGDGATCVLIPGAATILWGGCTVNVEGGGVFQNNTADTFANRLKVTALQLDGIAAGSSFNAAAVGNPFTAGINITSANLDTGGGAGNPGLQNPRTGSRYAST